MMMMMMMMMMLLLLLLLTLEHVWAAQWRCLGHSAGNRCVMIDVQRVKIYLFSRRFAWCAAAVCFSVKKGGGAGKFVWGGRGGGIKDSDFLLATSWIVHMCIVSLRDTAAAHGHLTVTCRTSLHGLVQYVVLPLPQLAHANTLGLLRQP
jgi:hypothetical protein